MSVDTMNDDLEPKSKDSSNLITWVFPETMEMDERMDSLNLMSKFTTIGACFLAKLFDTFIGKRF